MASSLPSLADIQTAIQAGDSDNKNKLRGYLQQILQSSPSSSSHEGNTFEGDGDGDAESKILELLQGVAKEMTQNEDLLDTLVDVLWLESYSSSGGEAVAQLLKILHEQHQNNDKNENVSSLQDRLLQNVNATLLEQSGWMAEKELAKRVRLFNTQSYYKQRKFNLLSEESQGYAKYLHLLITSSHATAPPDDDNSNNNSTIITQQVETLIGTFSLDPNRCLDLAVDVMMTKRASTGTNNNSNNIYDAFLPLFQTLPLQHLPELLALSLQHKTSNNSNKNHLLAIMSWMVRKRILSVNDMLDYLFAETTETLLTNAYQAASQAQKEAVRDMARVRLNTAASADTTAKDSSSNATTTTTATATTATTASTKALQLQKELADSWLIQFLQELLLKEGNPNRADLCFFWESQVQPNLTMLQWSQLCVLFPASIGVALCDIVLAVVENEETKCHPKNSRCSVPWKPTKNNSNSSTSPAQEEMDDNAMDTTTEENPNPLEDFVSKIDKTLETTRESGCIRLRPVLYTKLCRLFAHHLGQLEQEQEPTVFVLDFFKTFMLPSLSLFPCNPPMAHEVWSFLRLLSYQTRYDFYSYWRGSGLEKAALVRSDKPLWLVQSEIQAGKDARYSLKRLSKDTIRDMSRAIAKVCHSNPIVVFTTILNQIESYDNLVSVMVDALRFVTPLSLDVLSSCILSRLSGDASSAMIVNRSRLKADGVNVSQWLQSLEAFVGAFYKRFPHIDFRGILNYLLHQLKEGHVMELGILKTLLKTSAGWAFQDYSPAASLSASQLEGRAGSTLLKRETMSFGIVDEIDWRASNEVRRVLQTDDMGVSLLILLAQVRHQIVFAPQQRAPVKLVANMVDNCQVVSSILLDFLTAPAVADDRDDGNEQQKSWTTQAIAVYAKSLPSMQELFSVYRVDVASSWMLCRPLIRAASTKNASLVAGEADDALERFKSTDASRELYKEMLPGATWSSISTELFEAFFTNALYDICCPEEVYTTEIARVDKLSQQRSTPPPPSMQPSPANNDEEEQRPLKRITTKLSSDLSNQKKHVDSIRKLISSKKDRYFVSDKVSQEAAGVFLTRCIYPRLMQSPDDALYCAQFISILHEEETPGFGTLHFFDSLIVALSRALFGLTEGEAANVSILLCEVWKVVSKWRYDENAYKEQVSGRPGSFMLQASGEEPIEVSYRDYEDLYNKWHAALGAAALGCLLSPHYIHTRNCLIVLTRLVEVFPTRPGLANRLLKRLEPLRDESNSLADIRASAQAYSTQLLRARDDGVWKEESAASVLARQKKEKAAAAARQKQAVKQMEEIKRESEKITEEIGEWDGGRGRDRRGRDTGLGPRRAGGSAFDMPPPANRGTSDDRRPHDDRRSGAPTSRDAPREDRWARDRAPDRGVPDRGVPDRGGPDRGGPDRGPDKVAGSGQGGGTYTSMVSVASGASRVREDGPFGRSLEDRWQQRAGGKRSRGSSPVEEGEATRDEQRPTKRPRAEPEGGRSGSSSGGGGGGGGSSGGGGRRRGGGRR